MKRLFFVALTMLISFAGRPSAAQYLYMDVDGDGLNTNADFLTPYVTSVDIYLATDKSLANVYDPASQLVSASCATDPSPMTINSYQLIITSVVGGVQYGAWTDAMGFPIELGDVKAGNDDVVGRASAVSSPPGTYKLGTLAITVTGYPVLTFAASTSISDAVYTAFGSSCGGTDFDYTLKYNTDWMSVAGTRLVGDPIAVTQTTWGKIKNIYSGAH